MFDFRQGGITRLSKSQLRMLHRKCHRCNVPLPILTRNFFYCLKCKVIAKKERSLGRKLTSLEIGT